MLSRQEKMAWYNLAVFAVSLAVFVLLLWKFGRWKLAVAAFGIYGLVGFGPLIFFPRGRVKDFLDERDLSIQRRAYRTGYGVFWLVFVLGCMLTWHVLGDKGTVPADVLPMMPILGMVIIFTAGSITTLVLYRRGVRNAEE